MASADSAQAGSPNLRGRIKLIDLLKSDPGAVVGSKITVAGWIRSQRLAGKDKYCFLKIYDGTTPSELQVIVDDVVPGFHDVKSGSTGASVFISGEVVASQGGQQAFELKAENVLMLGPCPAETYPMAKKAVPSLESLRKIGHLRPRYPVIAAVTRIRNALSYATHTYFQQLGYINCHTPLITASDCEGGGDMFQVTTLINHNGEFSHKLPDGRGDFSRDFFKRPAFLTVSGQLNAEIYATALSSVYTFGPTFRAEDSHTSRHLAEFWMIEPEIAFADLNENMDVAEGFLKFTIQTALDKCPEDMAFLEDFEQKSEVDRAKTLKEEKQRLDRLKADEIKKAKAEAAAAGVAAAAAGGDEAAEGAPANNAVDQISAEEKARKKERAKAVKARIASRANWRAVPLRQRLKGIVASPFARVTYTEAITILQQAITDGEEFEEMNVVWGMDLNSEHERYLCEVHFQRPTVVTHYPKEIKAFYMRLSEDGKTVAAMDILVPGVGEICGGSQREERLEKLQQRIVDMKLKEEDYSWYLDLRRYGSVPHSGFGCGFERLVCYTSGIDNIRDAIPFPRYPGHADY